MKKLSFLGVVFSLPIALALSSGCKKDEPEEASAPTPEPEKVEAAQKIADDEAPAAEAEPEAAPQRKLVKGKTASQAAAENAGVPADEPAARRPGRKPPAAADTPTDPAEARRAAIAKARADAQARRARLKAAREGIADDEAVPEVAEAEPPRGPAVRPATEAMDDAEGGEEEEVVRGRPGPRRPGARPPTMQPVNDPTADPEPRGRPGARRYPTGRGRPTPRVDRTPPTLGSRLPTRVRPNAELLLRKDDLVEVLELKKTVDVHQLSGLDPDEEYDGIFWGSPDGKTYYAGVQVWRPRSPIEAQRRYTQMVRSYPNAEENTAVTNKTFLAYWNDFIYLVFFDSGKQTVVSLTCERKTCDSPQKLMLLASRIKERI